MGEVVKDSEIYLNTIGISIPNTFPEIEYTKTNNLISRFKDNKRRAWEEFIGGWKAVAYRFKACTEHHKKFIVSLNYASRTPYSPERYVQDNSLYGFFVTGFSALESYFYAMHAIGSIIDNKLFLLDKKSLRYVYPETVTQNYHKMKAINIFIYMNKLISSDQYKRWKENRNILTHRISPGRRLYSHTDLVRWKLRNIVIDETTTTKRIKWLSKQVSELIRRAAQFTDQQATSGPLKLLIDKYKL